MSFVSYAQNFEDVMLWRALKHIECGFYIDVGAWDPDVDSVTKAFYDRGWRGINIEPLSQSYQKLEEKRPRDINLQLAAGAERGEMAFYELADTGLSTSEKAIAERHEIELGYTKHERTVPVETLNSICDRLHLAPIHFLKIDVEGAEKDVLTGIDFSLVRPWIILVESTLPNTQTSNHADWDPLITAAGYDFVYFDGLNRFYVAHEHGELKGHFCAPPNVFDEFITQRQLTADLNTRQAEATAGHWQAEARQAEATAEHWQAEARQAEATAGHWQAEARQAEATAEHWQAEARKAEATAGHWQAEARQAEATAEHWQAESQSIKSRLEARIAELEGWLSDAEARVRELRAQADEWHQYILSVHRSTSWRLTAPMRAAKRIATGDFSPLYRVGSLIAAGVRRMLRPLAVVAVWAALKQPTLRDRLNARLHQFPKFREQLVLFARHRGLLPQTATPPCNTQADQPPTLAIGPAMEEAGLTQLTPEVDFANQQVIAPAMEEAGLTQLTPRARHIYAGLKHAIENNKELG